ncbi:conserved Plasmodium protein, unknown function [Plasmodium malariae]|uniref:Uncharacterized protein n=1 Tax=Plasmodium malariae TaxID=5858 RepID=A0A1D3TEP9_PLAMA|nr:conserved Plasmodium protein, unknown function [Plasmodium malariae]SCP03376.1 conserved Plasmodium protein, unknown function [Plasmodium malariae]
MSIFCDEPYFIDGSKDFECPEACPFISYNDVWKCIGICTTKERCSLYNPILNYADEETKKCLPCLISGCIMCIRSGVKQSSKFFLNITENLPNICLECMKGYKLSKDGRKCILVYEEVIIISCNIFLLLIFLLLLFFGIYFYKNTNKINFLLLKLAYQHRTLSKFRNNKIHGNPLYPLSIQVSKTDIGGVGLMLYFRFITFLSFLSILFILTTLFEVYLPFSELIQSYRNIESTKSFENCSYLKKYIYRNISRLIDIRSLDWMKLDMFNMVTRFKEYAIIICFIRYIICMIITFVFIYKQKLFAHFEINNSSNMRDFALSISDLPSHISEQEIKFFFEKLINKKIVGISWCHHFYHEKEKVFNLIDEQIEWEDFKMKVKRNYHEWKAENGASLFFPSVDPGCVSGESGGSDMSGSSGSVSISEQIHDKILSNSKNLIHEYHPVMGEEQGLGPEAPLLPRKGVSYQNYRQHKFLSTSLSSTKRRTKIASGGRIRKVVVQTGEEKISSVRWKEEVCNGGGVNKGRYSNGGTSSCSSGSNARIENGKRTGRGSLIKIDTWPYPKTTKQTYLEKANSQRKFKIEDRALKEMSSKIMELCSMRESISENSKNKYRKCLKKKKYVPLFISNEESLFLKKDITNDIKFIHNLKRCGNAFVIFNHVNDLNEAYDLINKYKMEKMNKKGSCNISFLYNLFKKIFSTNKIRRTCTYPYDLLLPQLYSHPQNRLNGTENFAHTRGVVHARAYADETEVERKNGQNEYANVEDKSSNVRDKSVYMSDMPSYAGNKSANVISDFLTKFHINENTFVVEKYDVEPTDIHWQNIPDYKLEIIIVKIAISIIFLFFIIIICSIIFYGPYAIFALHHASIMEKPKRHEVLFNVIISLVLGIFIGLGNFLVTFLTTLFGSFMKFAKKQSTDAFIFYVNSIFQIFHFLLNVLITHLSNSGGDNKIRSFFSSQLFNHLKKNNIILGEEYSLGRSLNYNILPLISLFPTIFSIFGMYILPFIYKSIQILFCSNTSIKKAEQLIQCPPCNLHYRYSEIVLSFTSTLLLFFFTHDKYSTSFTFLILFLSYLFIKYRDTYLFLRETKVTYYHSTFLFDAVMIFWSIPTGILAVLPFYWAWRTYSINLLILPLIVLCHTVIYFLFYNLINTAVDETKKASSTNYKSLSKVKAYNWFNTNPIHVLKQYLKEKDEDYSFSNYSQKKENKIINMFLPFTNFEKDKNVTEGSDNRSKKRSRSRNRERNRSRIRNKSRNSNKNKKKIFFLDSIKSVFFNDNTKNNYEKLDSNYEKDRKQNIKSTEKKKKLRDNNVTNEKTTENIKIWGTSYQNNNSNYSHTKHNYYAERGEEAYACKREDSYNYDDVFEQYMGSDYEKKNKNEHATWKNEDVCKKYMKNDCTENKNEKNGKNRQYSSNDFCVIKMDKKKFKKRSLIPKLSTFSRKKIIVREENIQHTSHTSMSENKQKENRKTKDKHELNELKKIIKVTKEEEYSNDKEKGEKRHSSKKNKNKKKKKKELIYYEIGKEYLQGAQFAHYTNDYNELYDFIHRIYISLSSKAYSIKAFPYLKRSH